MAWQRTNHVVTRSGSGTCHIEHQEVGGATPGFSRNTFQIFIDGFFIFVADWNSVGNHQLSVGAGFNGGGTGSVVSGTVSDGDGAWSYSYEVEVWEDHISTIPIPSPGSRSGETQAPPRGIRLGFKPKLGGAWSVSFYGLSLSGTITSAMVAVANPSDPQGVVPPEKCGYSIDGLINNAISGGGPPMSFTGTVHGQTIGGAPTTYSIAESVGSTNTCTVDATNTYSLTPTGTGNGFFHVTLNVETPGKWEIRGGARNATGDSIPLKYKAWGRKSDGTDVAIPVTLPTTITDRDGINLQNVGTFTPLFTRPVLRGLALTLDTSDAATLAEVGTDTRVLFRTKAWDGPTIAHAARITLDPCDSATSWTGAALVGGHLDVDSGTATKSYSPNLNAESGRFLALKVNPSVDDLDLKVTITTAAGKRVFFTQCDVSGTFTDAIIDLCSVPPAGGFSAQDSRWPDPVSHEEGGWGINYIQSIKIEARKAFTLSEIVLVRQTAPVITCSASELARFTTNGPSSPFLYTCAVIEIDGRRALEIPGVYGAPVLTPQSLSDLAGWLTGHPGFTSTVPSPSEWYHFTELCWLGGAGHDFYRKAWSMTDPIPMQGGVDAVYAFAGAGDVLYEGAVGSTTVLNVDKVVRGSWTGLVYQTRNPTSGISVESSQSTTTTGSGTTDALGIFNLTGDQSKAGVSTDLVAHTPSDIHGTATPSLRTEHRAVLAGGPKGRFFYRVAPDLAHYDGFVDGTTGTMKIGRADNATPTTFTDFDTQAPASWVSGRVVKPGRDRRLMIMYGDGSKVFIVPHITEGQLDMPITLGSGTDGEIIVTEDGTAWAYYLDGGTLKCKRFDANLDLKDTFDTDLTGIAGPVSLDESFPGGNAWRLIVHYTSSGSRLMATSIDGRHFT